MNFSFSNLGAIKATEMELRPLTIIIGPNNSNKTYIAYTVYGLLHELLSSRIGVPVASSGIDSKKAPSNYNWHDKLKSELSLYQRRAESWFARNLGTFFQDSSDRLFSGTSVKVSFSETEFQDALKNLSKIKAIKSLRGTINLSLSNSDIHIHTDDSLSFGPLRLRDVLIRLLNSTNNFIYPKPFLLPAERNAFVITYKMLANRRYKFLRETQRGLFGKSSNKQRRQLELLREQGDIRYPQPVEDFLDFLTDVELESEKEYKSKKRQDFINLADYIELNIQNNNKTNWKVTELGGREIKVSINKELEIDLYNASSSIKQISPLLLYLRYRAQENDLLIIDEPEMNLHPESQAKLLEALAILVNLGVKVLLTTHSPYFMAHLNNLVSGNVTNKSALKRQAEALYLKDTHAFLPLDSVSAYEMKAYKNEFKLNDLKDKDYGIRWDTLSDVSAEIQQKFFQIHEKGKAPSRATKKKKTSKQAKPKV